MGKLTIYRKKGLDFSPIHMVINDEIIPIKNGENKTINLPSGTYGISVKGIFGLGGNAKVEIKENESKKLCIDTNNINRIHISSHRLFIANVCFKDGKICTKYTVCNDTFFHCSSQFLMFNNKQKKIL